ncbi:hypothetical protein R8510_03320 [Ralstonia chuxiongensis]|nr:hypothetical protein R8510_03320 [Ralstonia chuxiongensis]
MTMRPNVYVARSPDLLIRHAAFRLSQSKPLPDATDFL